MSRTARILAAVRESAPLVHCLTATVSMELVADLLLAAGARPTMTWTEREAPATTGLADALLVNLGTLSEEGRAGMLATLPVAVERGLPWVLDPAAIGPAPSRVALARELLTLRPDVVRCNASELLVLTGDGTGGRGADATQAPEQALAAAARLTREHGCVVAVSGPVDHLTDGERVVRLANGTPMLSRVTGTGCALGALTAACCAADLALGARRGPGWALEAAVAATSWLALAGERAERRSRGPGSFRAALLDEVFGLDEPALAGERRSEKRCVDDAPGAHGVAGGQEW
ncbi:hydroxyethylthiazole kinase [Luteococcus peritonei]|uniref:Hydroxyethylthiazole kinase n=1 Tax=Luteococcus peritonei TaxID=88874 RepID=A0ABW4RXP8_9ACTN